MDGIGVYLNLWILDYIKMIRHINYSSCIKKGLIAWIVILDIFIVADIVITILLAVLPFSDDLLGSKNLNQINKAILRTLVALSFALIGYLFIKLLGQY